MMNAKSVSLLTTRWGAAATAAATAAAMCVSAAPAQAIVGQGGTPAPHAAVVAATGGFSASRWGNPTADAVSKGANGTYQAKQDPGSLFTVDKAIGARELWSQTDASGQPLTGQGVSVAVLDSGVAPVAGLHGAGKVTYGPDLSIEGNGVLTQQDTFGHGTFMAGIIAGRGTTSPSSDLSSAPADVQLGVAPDAGLLAMKLATTDGSVDVSQVIAALDWVTQHPVLPDRTRVRVINLSYGTNSAQAYRDDPLAAAAENAWKHGIVVVTSAGNGGSDTGRLTDPAIDPYLIAVGATDSNNSLDGWAPDHTTVASFSQVGSKNRHVDLVAPGTSLVSTRAPGSFVDVNNPSGLVTGDTSGTLFRGSGTSEATAVVSGSVALLLQAYPDLTPDQVKFALTSSADPITNADPTAVGAGTLDLGEAFDTASHLAGKDKPARSLRATAVQSFPSATGQGSIQAARAGSVLVDAKGKDLDGEIDVQGNAWNPATWWQATSTKSAWSGGKWLGVTWTGDDWLPASDGLSSARWSSARWSSARWSSADWSSARWSSARWSSARWSSARWSSGRWSSGRWSSARWSSADWS
ncbi:MAG TPA: S8 family serine peptidase [Dermatophilaceae bacterium]|nr:S8 family serine peptidase [Dermatophilaceae bacterium]